MGLARALRAFVRGDGTVLDVLTDYLPAEETASREWFCGRCGVWVNVAGDELGPPISPEQAMANYERRDFILTKPILLNPQEANVLIRPD